jgi:predicted nucleic acid-binding protein
VSIVVADNSPLNILLRVGCESVLPGLFQQVIVPQAVAAEMRHKEAPAEIRALIEHGRDWLRVDSEARWAVLDRLGPGESAAIQLAVKLQVPLLIDERVGRREAMLRGLDVIGAVGLLERAANLGLLPNLVEVHTRLRGSDFRVSHALLEASLARHLAFKAASGRPRP